MIDRGLPAAGGNGLNIGFPSNHECNSSVPREGWENKLAEFSPRRPAAPFRTLHRPADGGYIERTDPRQAIRTAAAGLEVHLPCGKRCCFQQGSLLPRSLRFLSGRLRKSGSNFRKLREAEKHVLLQR